MGSQSIRSKGIQPSMYFCDICSVARNIYTLVARESSGLYSFISSSTSRPSSSSFLQKSPTLLLLLVLFFLPYFLFLCFLLLRYLLLLFLTCPPLATRSIYPRSWRNARNTCAQRYINVVSCVYIL